MITYESLFTISKDQTEFLETHETGVNKLPIFDAIHAEESEEEKDAIEKLITSECGEYEGEEAGSSDSTTGSARDSQESYKDLLYLSD